ncbi:MAG: hypothetical protein LH606_10025 [Cytophagaceae bacterium]|nr:hypothetical protein [Cytophagaceae bacterium]
MLVRLVAHFFRNSPVLALIGIGGLMVLVTLAGIFHQAHHCTSPDSIAYLRLAEQAYRTGSVYHIPGWSPGLHSTWPHAYSLAIGLFHALTGLSYLIASKLVNYFALAATLFLLYKKHGTRAWLVGLAFWAVVKVYAYTWSEPLYFFGLIWFAHTLHALLIEPAPRPGRWFELYVAAVLVFATRYIGFFTFGLVAALAGYGFWTRRLSLAWKAASVFTLLVATAGFYFWLNEHHTGTFSGGARGTWSDEPLNVFLKTWLRVQLNELLLIRDWNFTSFDGLALAGLIFQLGMLGFVAQKLTHHPAGSVPRIAWGTPPLIALVYFAVALVFYCTFFTVRRLMPFNDLTYRTLCPATLFGLLGLLSWLTQRDEVFLRWKGTLLGFFFVVLLVSPLPATFRVSRVVEIVSRAFVRVKD